MHITREIWLYIAVAVLIVAGLAAKDVVVGNARAEQSDPIGTDMTQVAMAQPAFRVPPGHIVLVRMADGRVTDVPAAERRAWSRFAGAFGTHDVKIDTISPADTVGQESGPALWVGNMTTSLKKVALGRTADNADAILVYEVANGDSGAAIVAAYLLPGKGDAAPSNLVGIVIDQALVAANTGGSSNRSEVAGQIAPVATQLGFQFAALQADGR